MTQTPSVPSSMAPPVFSGSNSAASGSRCGSRTSAALPGRVVGPEDAQHGVEEEPQRALEGLERHVAGEPVGHDDVGRRGQQVAALEVAHELEAVRSAASTSRPWVSLTRGVPFVGSSPMERSPTRGRRRCRSGPTRRRRPSGRTAPAWRACTRRWRRRRPARPASARAAAAAWRCRAAPRRAGGPCAAGRRPWWPRCCPPRPWRRPSRRAPARRPAPGRSPSCGARRRPGPRPCR